jgi:hypothetical protein
LLINSGKAVHREDDAAFLAEGISRFCSSDDGPFHSFGAAHPQQFCISKRLYVFDVLHLRVDHPNIRQTNIGQELNNRLITPVKRADGHVTRNEAKVSPIIRL